MILQPSVAAASKILIMDLGADFWIPALVGVGIYFFKVCSVDIVQKKVCSQHT